MRLEIEWKYTQTERHGSEERWHRKKENIYANTPRDALATYISESQKASLEVRSTRVYVLRSRVPQISLSHPFHMWNVFPFERISNLHFFSFSARYVRIFVGLLLHGVFLVRPLPRDPLVYCWLRKVFGTQQTTWNTFGWEKNAEELLRLILSLTSYKMMDSTTLMVFSVFPAFFRSCTPQLELTRMLFSSRTKSSWNQIEIGDKKCSRVGRWVGSG